MAYIPVLLTMDKSGLLTLGSEAYSNFSSRLREDILLFWLTHLSLFQGSLTAARAYSFPSSPFVDWCNYNSITLLLQGLVSEYPSCQPNDLTEY